MDKYSCRAPVLVVGRDPNLPLPQGHEAAKPLTREQEENLAYEMFKEMARVANLEDEWA